MFVLPIVFHIPVVSHILRPFTGHFLRPASGYTLLLPLNHLGLVIRSFAVSLSTVLAWEGTDALFDKYVSQVTLYYQGRRLH